MKLLQNKIVFISGASSGIGQASAKAFAAAGCRLILCARRLSRLQALATQLYEQNQTATLLYELDIRDKQAVQQTIANLPQEWQAIDILLNNAGLAAGLGPLPQNDIDDWERMIDTNIKGLLYLTRYIVPGMVARDHGHIINIGSIAGHEVYANGTVYCATKHAVAAINEGLKRDLLGSQVRVTSIDPGMVNTEFSEVRFAGDQQKAATVYQGMTPLSADDIADAIVYCASRPAHVNIREMVILATDQSGATQVHRRQSS